MVARFVAVRLFIYVFILWTLTLHFTLWLSAQTLQCLLRAYHATTHSYFTWPWPVLDSTSYFALCSIVIPSVTG